MEDLILFLGVFIYQAVAYCLSLVFIDKKPVRYIYDKCRKDKIRKSFAALFGIGTVLLMPFIISFILLIGCFKTFDFDKK